MSWSGDLEVATERFADVCVVRVQRVGTGTFAPDIHALHESLAAALAEQGFDDLAVENDPGGAVLLVAHNSADALFEFRCKAETTVAVRVATSESESG